MVNHGGCYDKSDSELVVLSLKDAEWYGCLMQRYEKKLGRYIRRISGATAEDVEDLLQEIFLAVYRNLNDFDTSLKFSSWIYRIAHNKVISHYRAVKARADTIGGEEGEKILLMVRDGEKLHDQVNDRITGEVLGKLFHRIDVKYREVLILRYYEEKDYREISDILRVPIGTVATLLSRAKRRLREIIIQDGIQL